MRSIDTVTKPSELVSVLELAVFSLWNYSFIARKKMVETTSFRKRNNSGS